MKHAIIPPSSTFSSGAAQCAPEAKSFNYTACGERVDAHGGTYWIPAAEFARAVAAAQADPSTLNRYRFVPCRSPATVASARPRRG